MLPVLPALDKYTVSGEPTATVGGVVYETCGDTPVTAGMTTKYPGLSEQLFVPALHTLALYCPRGNTAVPFAPVVNPMDWLATEYGVTPSWIGLFRT